MHDLNNGNKALLNIGKMVTLEQFGAYGDGEHNDSNALINAKKWKKILLLDKTYKIESSNIFLPANFVMQGINKYKSTIYKTGVESLQDLFVCSDVNNIVLKDFKIYFSEEYEAIDAATYQPREGVFYSNILAIHITGCTNCLFENLSITNSLYDFKIDGHTRKRNRLY